MVKTIKDTWSHPLSSYYHTGLNGAAAVDVNSGTGISFIALQLLNLLTSKIP